MHVTIADVSIDAPIVHKYFHNLVNLFFKILPMRESGEETLGKYMENLRDELLGCRNLMSAMNNDAMFLSLIFNLQYMIDNPSIPVSEVRSKVFQAISVCNKLKERYSDEEVSS